MLHCNLLGSNYTIFKVMHICWHIHFHVMTHQYKKKKICWGCRGTLNLFCVHLRRPCRKSWGICVTRIFNCLTIYDELNCIGLQVYAIYMPYKSYCANLESRDGSWIIIMTLGKDNYVLTYFFHICNITAQEY